MAKTFIYKLKGCFRILFSKDFYLITTNDTYKETGVVVEDVLYSIKNTITAYKKLIASLKEDIKILQHRRL